MALVRITKSFTFEAAHALRNYNGPCATVHGHSYRIEVTVKGVPQSNPESGTNGMVMDFGELKTMVKLAVVDKFDHSLMMHEKSCALSDALPEFANILRFPFQPTSENLVCYVAEIIKKLLPSQITLHSVILHETATSYASWYAEDQS